MSISLLSLLLALAQDQHSQQARAFIEKLRSENVEDRDEGEARLKEMSRAAVPELEKATKDKDPEVAARADALLFAILKRIPSLQEPLAVPLPAGGPFGIAASSMGRFVILSELTSLNIFDAATLKPVHSVRLTATGFGFDEKDEVLTVLGADVRRIETATWKESFRANLPDPDCGKMGQSLVTPKGKAFYLTTGGGLSIASVEGEKLKLEPQDVKSDGFGQIDRILAVSGDGLLVADRSGFGDLWLRGKVYHFAYCKNVVAASSLLGKPVYVCKNHINFYTERYKNLATVPPQTDSWIDPPGDGNAAAAFDQRKGIVFAFRDKALHARSIYTPEFEQTYTELPMNTSALGVNSDKRILYAIAGGQLLRWRLRD